MAHRRVVAALGAALFGIAGSLTVAQPALAFPTCPYPYVCFYARAEENAPNNPIIGRFQSVTDGWQWLDGAYGADYVVNTRNDDVAHFHMTDGRTYCVENNSSRSFENDEPLRYVDGIRISSNANC
ncbi:hypothetical protein BDK92_3715 [Micromonospora pisi]|uniref:Peptidase inhibitor family I36 n=1 Tax=Micromonospora pisi TaxID=589240 RepID=A0A495JKL4_9ACTN|nr:hypothetical protein [Micromonospora pisi]RKR89371.1 hypothetical protein BDK92_3715 [Micromonospora pisi]